MSARTHTPDEWEDLAHDPEEFLEGYKSPMFLPTLLDAADTWRDEL